MKSKQPFPPKFFLRFFRWFCHPRMLDYIEGDLLEVYERNFKTMGKRKADWKFIKDVLLLFRPGIIRPRKPFQNLTTFGMYKSYFKIGWRNLIKNKGYSAINIGGLAVGLTAAILIALWVRDELSFNKNFENYDKIAQVLQNQTFNGEVQTWWSQARQIAPELRNHYGSDFKYVIMSSWNGSHKFTFDDKDVRKEGSFMEPEVTEMLTLNMLSGTRDGLNDPNSILLSGSAAKDIFGDLSPLGQAILMDDKLEVMVTGVYEDLPRNSSFHNLTFIAPWELYVSSENLEERTGWGNSWFHSLAQIEDNADMDQVSLKIKDVKLNAVVAAGDNDDLFKPEIFLHPMSRWHLYSDFKNGVSVGGGIQYVWLFGLVGVFVLFLACINFINLNTARSEKRAKEVGIRKALGSVRIQLINQFFTESMMVVILSFILSLILAQLALPLFNEVSGKQIDLLWSNPYFWIIGLGFTILTGMIAGSFPALYISSFHPARVLKGAFKAGRFSAVPRKILVVAQFTVSITLIIGTLIVFKQIQFTKNRPIGYDNMGVISAPIRSEGIREHFDAFRNDLQNTGSVKEVALTDSPLTATNVTNSGFTWEGKDPGMAEEFATLRVTHEFGEMIDWQILEGRDFSRDFASDTMAFIINESAAKYLGMEDPVGKSLKWGNNGEYKIIGMVKDMVTQSPYSPVKQMLFFLNYKRVNMVHIKINPDVSATEALSKIETVFKKHDPANDFEYSFVDQDYGKNFDNERRIAKLTSAFAGLAMLICCLGLFGLASFMAEQRTKEIGIRKVMGASVVNLWSMMSKDFVRLVVISSLISIPIAFHFLSSWLENYEYRTPISWWIFAASGFGAVLITLLTVSYQSLKAALINPVRSLKTE
ncbi:ABC-type antimicrobial peptide transport system permease subunit [Algoriphagus iocasae]|uniref:ABC-type antimicrobial peptide transport system permease subunit n=1 Tax=Algoriphagus iocasae TaxID=1836499 RepID=A0A841MUY5_9BACT|nr:ABC transporter permease [Algoriphagus iocasae]MBB6325821.1 ABC-type antimicrobial peptide transport system permease subunit [Algoriphagus iocasae]